MSGAHGARVRTTLRRSPLDRDRWKADLINRCLARVADDRELLVTALRQRHSIAQARVSDHEPEQEDDLMQNTLTRILGEELAFGMSSSSNSTTKSTFQLVHTAPTPANTFPTFGDGHASSPFVSNDNATFTLSASPVPITSSRADLACASPDVDMLFDSMDDAYIEHLQQRGDTETPTFNIDDYGDLTPQERTEILLAMQAALLTDQADLEQAALEAEAERELRLEAAAIQSSVDHQDQFDDDDSEHPLVICPCCQKKYLVQALTVILCKCGFRLDTQHDGLSLRQLKARLHVCVEQHGIECPRAPCFKLISNYGLDALYLECDTCNAFALVM